MHKIRSPFQVTQSEVEIEAGSWSRYIGAVGKQIVIKLYVAGNAF